MKTPEIFGRYKVNLIKLYELLRAAEDPLPRTRLMLTARQGIQYSDYLFYWLLDQGFIEEVDYSDVAGEYMGHYRKPLKSNKGLFKITTKGKEVRRMYDVLFKALGLNGEVWGRFPE